MFLTLLIFCVGSVCATDTDNITVDNSLSGVNSNIEIVNDIEISNINSDSVNNNVPDDNDYCCGVIAFQSALKENGINISLEEAKEAVKPNVNGSTSMQGLIDGAKKYNLSAIGASVNINDLKVGYIVHINLSGVEHWVVIENILDEMFLNNMINNNTILNFKDVSNCYTNHTVIISQKLINNLNGTILNRSECEKITAEKSVIRKHIKNYKLERHFGLIKCTGYHLKPVVKGGKVHFSQWQLVKGTHYTLGFYDKRVPKSKKRPLYKSNNRLTSTKYHKKIHTKKGSK